jgi:LacI family transcriptional regulator, galactose operon repressor
MAVTINDVARAAGVSASTVSRALSLPDKVDPATRERILRVAEHLGYQPNRAARGLITGRTGNLGLILPDLANPHFPSLVKTIQHHAHRADYQLLMMDTDEDPSVELSLVRSLAKQVDGVILCSPRMRPADLREAAALGPTVLVNRRAPYVAAVIFDHVDGMRQILAHLADLGHRDIGYAGGPRSSWSNQERLRGLREVSAQLDLHLVELGHFHPTFEGGRVAVEGTLLSGVTAVVAYNDLVAVGLCRALAERGVEVPTDLSVVGIDNITLAGMVQPALTTLALPTDTAGRAAVDMIVKLLTDLTITATGTPRVDVPAELLVRDSTSRPGTTRSSGSTPPGRRRPARRS